MYLIKNQGALNSPVRKGVLYSCIYVFKRFGEYVPAKQT